MYMKVAETVLLLMRSTYVGVRLQVKLATPIPDILKMTSTIFARSDTALELSPHLSNFHLHTASC